MSNILDHLRRHVTGAIERGEAEPVIEMTDRKFVIVEQAGYEGERDITHFPTLREALAYQRGHYEPGEWEELHCDIRQDWTDADGDHQEYVY